MLCALGLGFWLVSGPEQLFYWGEARCLIFCWVEELGSLHLLVLCVGWRGSLVGMSTLHQPWASSLWPHALTSPFSTPTEGVCSPARWGVGGGGGVGVCQVSGVGLSRDLL